MTHEPMTADVHSQTNVPDRDAIRTELYAMRDEFHALLDEAQDVWNQQTPSTRWTVRHIFGHLLSDVKDMPEMVERASAGDDFLNLPSLVVHPLNYLHTRVVSRGETPQSVAEKYDEYFEEALAALDEVEDNEWDRGANFFDAGYWTVEDVFRNAPAHFEEHAAQIRKAIEQSG